MGRNRHSGFIIACITHRLRDKNMCWQGAAMQQQCNFLHEFMYDICTFAKSVFLENLEPAKMCN